MERKLHVRIKRKQKIPKPNKERREKGYDFVEDVCGTLEYFRFRLLIGSHNFLLSSHLASNVGRRENVRKVKLHDA